MSRRTLGLDGVELRWECCGGIIMSTHVGSTGVGLLIVARQLLLPVLLLVESTPSIFTVMIAFPMSTSGRRVVARPQPGHQKPNGL